MRRALVAMWLVLAAGCGGNGGHGPASTRYFYYGADSSDSYEATVDRRVFGDGSEELHGETLLDRPTMYMRLEVVEDVTLDPQEHLVTADMSIRNTTGGTLHEKRIRLDAKAGEVSITRPSGHTVWHVANDLPWAYYAMWSDPFWLRQTPTPVSAWVFAHAKAGSAQFRYVAYDAVDDLVLPGLPTRTSVRGELTIYDDSYQIDDDFVAAFHSDTGDLDVARVDRLDLAPLAFEVPEGATTIPFPDCAVPGTATPFAVASSDGTMVHGEVDEPAGAAGPRPYVVFYAGTGGSDRHQMLGGTPRWDCLAKPLVAAGVAVVRFDDRGQGETEGDASAETFVQRSEDAAAVAAFAASRPDVDPQRLFLLGHSEGAAHASDAAAAVPGVDGLILAGGIGTTGRDVLVRQTHQVIVNYGYPAEWIAQADESYEKYVESLENGTASSGPDDLSVAFWQQFLAFDGAAKARAGARPALIAQGGRDWQVDPANAGLLAAALHQAGVEDVTVKTYPLDGHYLIPAPTGFPSCGEEQHLPIGWDAAFVNDVVTWIQSH